MKIPNRLYDVLKWIALTALDALGWGYKQLATVWGLPFGPQVLETCAIVSAVLGALIGVSSISYVKQQRKQLAIEESTEDIIED